MNRNLVSSTERVLLPRPTYARHRALKMSAGRFVLCAPTRLSDLSLFPEPSDAISQRRVLHLVYVHESGSWDELMKINSPIAHGFSTFSFLRGFFLKSSRDGYLEAF